MRSRGAVDRCIMRSTVYLARLALFLPLLVWGCGGTAVTDLSGPTVVRCALEVAPLEVPVAAGRQTGSISITAERECTWSAASRASWIAIASGTGQGDGQLEYVVSENQVPAERRGVIAIGGHDVHIVQEAAPCSYRLRPQSGSVGAGGGAVRVDVESFSGCSWTATTQDPWISVRGGSGDGSGSVILDVAANTGSPRQATVSVGEQPFLLVQAGACSFSVGHEQSHVPSGGGAVEVAVGAEAWCEWTAVPQVPWIAVPNGGARAGHGTVTLTVGANSGPPRSGGVLIAGQLHTVTQDAAPCVAHVEPLSQDVPFTGGVFSVTVVTQSWCDWSAVSHAGWVQITSGHQGTGTGVVTFTVDGRPVPFRRTATLTIAGHTVTVQQR
jgi:hypothetical protein